MSDKETAPHFQVPPDHATREELIGALQYWVIRAKTAERVAVECRAPAPQPANGFSDADWKWWFELTAEGRLNMIRRFRAATPQVTPELEPGEFFITRGDGAQERCRYVSQSEVPAPTSIASGMVWYQDNVLKQTHKFEGTSEQASPTPDKCQTEKK